MRKTWFIVWVGIALLVVGRDAAAATIRHDLTQHPYEVLASQYPAVGRVTAHVGSAGWFGSATLVAPRWIVTAAHVVDEADAITFAIAGRTYSATGWYTHPGWNGDLLGGTDLALIHFRPDIADETGVTPVKRFYGNNEVKQRAVFAGFGRTGTGLTGDTAPYTAAKLAYRNRIDTTGAWFTGGPAGNRILLSDFDGPTPTDNLLGRVAQESREGLIAPGDSGGGVFLTVNGSPRLVGVHSFVFPNGSTDFDPNSDYGDASGHTRISTLNSWIDQVFRGELRRTMVRPMSLTSVSTVLSSTSLQAVALPITSLPEPTTALPLLALATLRRRRQ